MGKRFGACRSADVKDDGFMHEQSISALKKTPACDRGQNLMGCVVLKQCEGLVWVSSV